ncbi:MAG: DUF4956 domain-containing protein [Lachnospiraceae bacterium]|nr:DUF4956 domain-containing protein [Lachnospiraceae bacterium]
MNNLFEGMFDNNFTDTISVSTFMICLCCALVIGFLLAWMSTYHTRYTKSFVITLAILPAVVCVVIMMVNGNVGTGVAVAGAFSLIRFRSVPGTAREIGSIFMAMGAGLLLGMGYIGLAFLFVIAVGALKMLYEHLDFGVKKNGTKYKSVHITVPEDLDYCAAFEEVFSEYTSAWELIQVKTTNMGSLFRLVYHVTLKNPEQEKAFIDKLRTRNGNLEIVISRQESEGLEL